MSGLLDDIALERSWVVANSLMNRERGCAGGNSYAKELALNPIEFLRQRLSARNQASWLDICCGSGKALIEAASCFKSGKLNAQLCFVGIDLTPMFFDFDPYARFLRLESASIFSWRPDREFDLITCVHGLHYVGDKLKLIRLASSWLADEGFFIANIDPANFRLADGTNAGRMMIGELRKKGFQYDSKKHLLSIQGKRKLELKFRYLGADDKAGSNYTGQPAVNSYYARS
ncbi:MAG TPA: methyltransferase domain-containing protein [Blastocatellia bacterium]|jgi:SAM-dependent methyltransferase